MCHLDPFRGLDASKRIDSVAAAATAAVDPVKQTPKQERAPRNREREIERMERGRNRVRKRKQLSSPLFLLLSFPEQISPLYISRSITFPRVFSLYLRPLDLSGSRLLPLLLYGSDGKDDGTAADNTDCSNALLIMMMTMAMIIEMTTAMNEVTAFFLYPHREPCWRYSSVD